MEEDANEASARDHRAVIGVHTRASTHSCRDPRHAHGRGWLDELVAGNVTSVEQIAAREKCSMACQFDPGDLREQTRDGARNGFGEPRDREPKLAQANPQPAAETVRRVFEPAERPQNAGYSSETGKRRFVSECVVVDAVTCQPVSSLQFWEMQGDSDEMQRGGTSNPAKSYQFSRACIGLSLL